MRHSGGVIFRLQRPSDKWPAQTGAYYYKDNAGLLADPARNQVKNRPHRLLFPFPAKSNLYWLLSRATFQGYGCPNVYELKPTAPVCGED